jgi:hypothetical protein
VDAGVDVIAFSYTPPWNGVLVEKLIACSDTE